MMGVTDGSRTIRSPVAAGNFYPGSRERLAVEVDRLLAGAMARSGARPKVTGSVRGIIAPHAGYEYSGPIAATAYSTLLTTASAATATTDASRPRLVVILGPSHFEPLRGLAVSRHGAWRTPLGDVVVDSGARRRLVDAGAVIDEAPHRSEHSIEVQLPFVQRCLPGIAVLPVAVGNGAPEWGATTLLEVMADDALLVVSTDLSHYLDVMAAREQDGRTAEVVETMDLARLRPRDACGVDALRVGIAWARMSGCRIRLLDLRSSADTAGDPARVVGYGAFEITSGGKAPAPGRAG